MRTIRFPPLRPVLWDGAVVLTVLVLAGALLLELYRVNAADRLEAVVYMDGAETDRVDLSGPAVTKYYTHNGLTLQVRFEDGGAQVMESECPTQVCVHTGRVTQSGQAIICLPAGVVVRIEGGDGGPDAVLR